MSDTKQNPGVQGEGDYRSARRHRRDAEEFVAANDQHDIEKLAREAAPKSDVENREMLEAEREGRARAKGRKPADVPTRK